ncbi:MAG: hypothetical protein K6G11_09145 [Lachnospiraceae bacterium]|nr:hypothetical protein [Lachnospiraceae bacterium]
MQTDKIIINSNGSGIKRAMKESEKFGNYINLSQQQALQLRLLSEEALNMICEIVGDYEAIFYLQSERNRSKMNCELHIEAKAEIDIFQRDELVKVSTSGENKKDIGIMGKIRSLFGLKLSHDKGSDTFIDYSGLDYCSVGMINPVSTYNMQSYWSLETYRQNLSEMKEKNSDAWDELEKSIIANIADDVTVGVDNENVELVIKKTFSN